VVFAIETNGADEVWVLTGPKGSGGPPGKCGSHRRACTGATWRSDRVDGGTAAGANCGHQGSADREPVPEHAPLVLTLHGGFGGGETIASSSSRLCLAVPSPPRPRRATSGCLTLAESTINSRNLRNGALESHKRAVPFLGSTLPDHPHRYDLGRAKPSPLFLRPIDPH